MIRVDIIQTGTVTIRPHHRCGKEGRRAWQRKVDLLRDRGWTQPLPIYAYLIEHPEGIYLVDTGDRARNSDKGYLPRWNPFFQRDIQVKVEPSEEIGVQLAARGINVRRDVKGVLMTHPHHDHAGGSITSRIPPFSWDARTTRWREAFEGALRGACRNGGPGGFTPH
jgi:glyoxylase-like metal-dependent hydrolase (beta-lactamase superfamily II)